MNKGAVAILSLVIFMASLVGGCGSSQKNLETEKTEEKESLTNFKDPNTDVEIENKIVK